MFAKISRMRAMVGAALVGAALVAGCGAAQPQVRSGQLAQEVLRDPVERLQAMQQMRMQILRKTNHIDEDRYLSSVRPGMAGQLVRAGFTHGEAAAVLGWVDEARADRARVERWWSSLTGGAASERHSMR
jgi:hypothetical protein